MDVLNGSLDAPDPDPSLGDPVNHIATLARLADGPRRPSVEILFHALIPDTYVLHTHPLPINAITCNADGEKITAELFGDEVLWVGYTDPGLPLARLIARRRGEFEARTGAPAPKATFLMNHGLIVAGDSPDDVRALSRSIVERIDAAVAAERGVAPIVAVAPGLAVFAVGESEKQAATALGVYVDALTVGEAASRLGRVRAMDERERRFIETWEAEAYRQQVAKTG
jgi:rhamnose utilization protein RhaD (predicted bifunctional aldolase and dehydrogenase)